MARGLKCGIYEKEGLYYLCSENKGTDQLRGYREADLHLCFRICKNPGFSHRGSYYKGLPRLSLIFLVNKALNINSKHKFCLEQEMHMMHLRKHTCAILGCKNDIFL